MIHPKESLFPKSLDPDSFLPERSTTKPLHAVWIIISYVPDKNSGAECMTHAINRFLLTKGWTVSVLTPSHSRTSFEGVHIVSFHHNEKVRKALYEASHVFSYLHYQTLVAKLCATLQKPYIAIHHNSFQIRYTRDILDIVEPKNFYIVNNSQWLQQFYKSSFRRVKDPELQEFSKLYDSHSHVLYPPVDYRDFSFSVAGGDSITLVNCSEEKGGGLLVDLAKAMPDQKFLGVIGSYNKQINEELPNLSYMKNTPRVRDFYSKTKIIIMPSVYESWGRVAVEAMSLGIPVIAHPTPGLRESLGSAGIFVDRKNLSAWIRSIRELLENPWLYARKSMESRVRSKELDPRPQLKSLESWLADIQYK
jgi:glycosyltransferase involved in cell wall biosynthesis